MKTTKDAHAAIADNLLQKIQSHSHWEFLKLTTLILNKNLGGVITTQKLLDGFDLDIPIGRRIFEIQEAILSLRDEHLRTTGRRIWGLTFTLYPDGKFNIKYDYKKPEDYEDSDEVMSGDEINSSLNSLLNINKGDI